MRERVVVRQTSFVGCKNCWAFGLVGSEGYSTTVVGAVLLVSNVRACSLGEAADVGREGLL